MPTLNDVAWAAGFIDGDGCINIYQKHENRRKRKPKYPLPMVQVGVTERELLEKLKMTFGGSIVGPYNGKGFGKNTNVFHWNITCKKAAYACAAMMPFLQSKVKRKRATEVLLHYRERSVYRQKRYG